MSLNLNSLTEVANDTLALIGMIRAVGEAGGDEKTKAIEASALSLIEKLTAAAESAAAAGSAPTADVRTALEAQRKVLETRLQAKGLSLDEFTAVQSELGNIELKLFIMGVDKTLTWDRLLSPEELAMFGEKLREAAQQVRRRKKLATVVQSLTSAFTMALSLTSKVVGLAM